MADPWWKEVVMMISEYYKVVVFSCLQNVDQYNRKVDFETKYRTNLQEFNVRPYRSNYRLDYRISIMHATILRTIIYDGLEQLKSIKASDALNFILNVVFL